MLLDRATVCQGVLAIKSCVLAVTFFKRKNISEIKKEHPALLDHEVTLLYPNLKARKEHYLPKDLIMNLEHLNSLSSHHTHQYQ